MLRCAIFACGLLLCVVAPWTADALPFQASAAETIAEVIRDVDGDFVPDRLDDRVHVAGVATTNSHVARDDIRYIVIQDDTGAIRILTTDEQLLADIEPGSIVEVTGLLTQRRGVEELFVETLRVTGSTTPPAPREVLVADLLSERYTHQLVRVTGTLTIANIVPGEALGARLADRSGSIPVRIPDRLRNHPDLAGQWAHAGAAEIIGIAGQADLEAPFGSDYRLAPREATDIVLIPTPPYGAMGFATLLTVLVAAVLALSIMRRRAERRADAMAALAADLRASREALAADLAERRRLERQLLQAQKMEALGRMAGGIAHDLNNTLTTVMGTAEMLLDSNSDARTTEGLTWIREAAERSSDLSRGLLALSRQKPTAPQIVDLDTELRELITTLRGLVRSNVELVAVHHEEQLWIEIDPAQLKQMLLNLVVNANEAMPSGGRLVIETRRLAAADGDASPAGPRVVLRVSDSGDGIDAGALDHVFEPFFSTKQDGSGLGLAIVYGVVQGAGGDIEVHSVAGEGAAFVIRLPEVTPPGATTEEVPAEPEIPTQGSGRILLVEDDPNVRSLAHQVLDRAGYSVTAATDGREAWRVFAAAPQAFDLLLTDVVMPQTGGAELAEQVAAERPDLPVVFMSGYIDDTDASSYIADRNAVFLQKPWKVGQLLTAVARVIDPNRAA